VANQVLSQDAGEGARAPTSLRCERVPLYEKIGRQVIMSPNFRVRTIFGMTRLQKLLTVIAWTAVYLFIGCGLLFYSMLVDVGHSKGPECCAVATTHYWEATEGFLSLGLVVGLVFGIRWVFKS
jgi:hypothetical protein